MITFALPAIIFFREKPKFPASALKLEKSEHSIWTEFLKLIKIKNFCLLSINFMFMTTIYDLIALLIDPLTKDLDYTGGEKGILAVIFCFTGVGGLILIKFLLD
jgi:hypothetical protein